MLALVDRLQAELLAAEVAGAIEILSGTFATARLLASDAERVCEVEARSGATAGWTSCVSDPSA
jgi:hypothetical protein